MDSEHIDPASRADDREVSQDPEEHPIETIDPPSEDEIEELKELGESDPPPASNADLRELVKEADEIDAEPDVEDDEAIRRRYRDEQPS